MVVFFQFFQFFLLLLAAPPTPAEYLAQGRLGWTVRAEPQRVLPDDLYTYMNGGAEIYLEYGFQELLSQDFARGEDLVTVELYRMKDDAFGIFSFSRSTQAQPLEIGDGGALAGFYLTFWSGPFYCAITAQDEFKDAETVLTGLAADLAALLPRGHTRPPLLGFLPRAGRIEGSEKYFVGAIGLRNACAAAAQRFKDFREGGVVSLTGQAGSKATAGCLAWDDAGQAAKALQTAGALGVGTDGVGFQAWASGEKVFFVSGGAPEDLRRIMEEFSRAR